MPKTNVKITGAKELQKALINKAKMNEVKSIVMQNGAELQQKAQRNAPVRTGDLRRSIGLEILDNGMTAQVAATMNYSAYVEYGTRYMNAQPYMSPAFHDQKIQFQNDLKKLM